jgi:hypothetical protein
MIGIIVTQSDNRGQLQFGAEGASSSPSFQRRGLLAPFLCSTPAVLPTTVCLLAMAGRQRNRARARGPPVVPPHDQRRVP